jgi:GTP cyclohydrolase I
MSASALSLPTPHEDACDAVSSLLVALGEDPEREGLKRTPERVAKALDGLCNSTPPTSA